MARVTPSNGEFIEWELPEFQSVRLTLLEVGIDVSGKFKNSDGTPKKQANLKWEVSDFGDEEMRPHIRDWPNITVGEMQGGSVSKMRSLINRIHGRAENAPISWIDDGIQADGTIDPQTALTYSLEGNPDDPNCPVDGQIAPGVQVYGLLKKKEGKTADDPVRYGVDKYVPPLQVGTSAGGRRTRNAASARTPAPTAATPPAAAEEEGETCPDCGLVDAHKRTCPQIAAPAPAVAAPTNGQATQRSARAQAAARF